MPYDDEHHLDETYYKGLIYGDNPAVRGNIPLEYQGYYNMGVEANRVNNQAYAQNGVPYYSPQPSNTYGRRRSHVPRDLFIGASVALLLGLLVFFATGRYFTGNIGFLILFAGPIIAAVIRVSDAKGSRLRHKIWGFIAGGFWGQIGTIGGLFVLSFLVLWLTGIP